MRFPFYLVVCIFMPYFCNAQLELCQGIKGELALYENFGDGIGFGFELPIGQTTYNYTLTFPEEGEYTIYSNTFPGLVNLPGPDEVWPWHLMASDWSNNINYTPGKMLLVNANGGEGTFYSKKISGLCTQTTYEFSFWAAALYNINSSVCNNQGLPVNLRMEVWDISETELLKFAETGNINNSSSINFQNYGLLFTTDQHTDVIIKIINNAQQVGCGNDVAIDEIKVQVCGGSSTLTAVEYGGEEIIFCQDDLPSSLVLEIQNNYQGSYFMWQRSVNGTNWSNIGAITYNNGGNYTLDISENIETGYYRVVFASFPGNFNSPLTGVGSKCSWYSNSYYIKVNSPDIVPVSFGSPDLEYCGDSTIPTFAVFPTPFANVEWYDLITGGNLLHTGPNYTPPGPGTYYAQYSDVTGACRYTERATFTLTWVPGVDVPPSPDPVYICGGQEVILDAGSPNQIYEWSPSSLGDGQTAIVNEPGIYTVTVRNNSECVSTRTFTINGYANPQISNISHFGTTVYVTMSNNDYYEYSLDGVSWQNSNVFYNVEPGVIKVYARDLIQCGIDVKEYFILSPPKFFTPNGDGVNDFYTIKGVESLNLEIIIFDRYGKIITGLNSSNPVWDGLYDGEPLPSSDYWYRITIDNQFVMTGHFTLKR